MKLDLKYKFRDEVYVVYIEDDGIVRVFKDKIVEFSMSEQHGLHYYVDKMCEEFEEEDLIQIDKPHLLIARINELLRGGKNEDNRTNI